MSRSTVLFYVNGQRREVSGAPVVETLLNFLRYTERLTGTKLGCGEGGCGACTVLLSSYNAQTNRIHHRAINACLMPLAACDGTSITTIEAVGDRCGGLAPVQQALVDAHGSQCGFCTPGIVMSMFALLRQHAADPCSAKVPLNEADVQSNFDGNLCRCTGYRPILDAFQGLVYNQPQARSSCVRGDDCCKLKGSQSGTLAKNTVKLDTSADHPLEPPGGSMPIQKEYLFPPELIQYQAVELNLCNGKWLRPVSLQRLTELKLEFPLSKIIVGNTELGIEVKFKGFDIPAYLCASHVSELSVISESEMGVRIGASVTWSQLNSFIEEIVADRNPEESSSSPMYQVGSLLAIQSQLRRFAGKQIRNVAAIGGNIVTASPISDVNPVWMAAATEFILLDCRSGKERTVSARDFFLSYRKVDMAREEILLALFVPWNESWCDFTYAFKVSRRQEDDIAIVSAGIRFRLTSDASSKDCSDSNMYRIKFASVSLGGVAPQTIAVKEVESVLEGKIFDKKALHQALEAMARSTVLSKDVPGGMPEFRQSLSVSFLFKAFVMSAKKIDEHNLLNNSYKGSLAISSLGVKPEVGFFSSTEDHQISRSRIISSDRAPQCKNDRTGKSVAHMSASLQVSGEAKYLDDIAPIEGELQAELVLSTEAHAEIASIDYSVAEKMPGVFRIICHEDVRGENTIGMAKDEECFATNMSTTVGQVIAIVLAQTLEQAKKAAKAVIVKYNVLPSIVTIEEAIEAGSYAPGVPDHTIQSGDTLRAFQIAHKNNRIVQGCVRIGAQEHWYLEPHGSLAIPDENGEMTIWSSTQTPSMTQSTVARVLGEPMHKVVCKVKRIGGGFGGKETRSFFISAAAAVAAQVTSRPIRLVLERNTDMLITGTRHAFLAKYKAAYEPNGRIVALDLEIYLNMGNSTDLSISVLDRCLYHAQNCYDIRNVNFVGKACFTNTASSTAFRGFGAPQGMFIVENVIERIACATKHTPDYIRSLNMFGKNGNRSITPFGMEFNANPLVLCWDEVLRDSLYAERRKEVMEFNNVHQYRKRGISAIPSMFGIGFTLNTLNQAGALVHIFRDDGSVLITHGGVEMGQGLHTKICQVASTELGVPLEKVFISGTATDKVPNASPTAASISSDIYGMAVKRACETLNRNLEPCRALKGPHASWSDIILQAWLSCVSLSATGFYSGPLLDDLDLGVPGSKGTPFFYYTNGAAVTEVELDVLTGETQMLRTDIVMDIGRALNPAIDVGQIEGAFIQGLGWCTLEEVVKGSSKSHPWVKPGNTHTLGPSTYKIPGFNDIPKDFRVRVLNTRNEQDLLHSSKAVGEPPLFLAASAFFAIRDAIGATHSKQEENEWFELDSPATVERVKMACKSSLQDIVLQTGPIRPSLSL